MDKKLWSAQVAVVILALFVTSITTQTTDGTDTTASTVPTKGALSTEEPSTKQSTTNEETTGGSTTDEETTGGSTTDEESTGGSTTDGSTTDEGLMAVSTTALTTEAAENSSTEKLTTIDALFSTSVTIGQSSTKEPATTDSRVTTTDEPTASLAPKLPRYNYAKLHGNIHVTTFDKFPFIIAGNSHFTFAKDCSSKEPIFQVLTQHAALLGDQTTSEVIGLEVEVEGIIVQLQRSSTVKVNGVSWYLPIILGSKGTYIWQAGDYIIVETIFGLQVRWSTVYGGVHVGLTNNWKSAVCGLAGNFNDYPFDDFADQSGTVLTVNQFAKRWEIRDGTGGSGQDIIAKVPMLPCNDFELSQSAITRCYILIDASGPLGSCIAALQEDYPGANYAFFECVSDVCSGGMDIEDRGCGSIAAFVSDCNIANHQTGEWRNYATCEPRSCPVGSQYYVGRQSICPETCVVADQFDNDLCRSTELVEGCFCDPGLKLEGGNCIPEPLCGCFYDGSYHKRGTEFTTTECSEKCYCSESGELSCQSISCHEKGRCGEKDGVWGCHCERGYIGDGIHCRELCNQYECPAPEYDCISNKAVCNFNCDCEQCADEDEDLCCNAMNSQKHCPFKGGTRCDGGRYIDSRLLCDGKEDCDEGSDESDKHCSGYCDSISLRNHSSELRISLKQARYPPDFEVTFNCTSNYVLEGNDTIRCEDGNWTTEYPTCLRPCPSLKDVVNGVPSNTRTLHGTSVNTVCDTGYESVDSDRMIVCNNGNWSGSLPACININDCASNPCVEGMCLDGINNYSCECFANWTGPNCDEDINECMEDPTLCTGPNEKCENTDGSYNCTCKEGFSLNHNCGRCVGHLDSVYLPFGPSNGDTMIRLNVQKKGKRYLRHGDFSGHVQTYSDLVSETISVQTGFPLGDNFYHSLYIVENGIIIFTKENVANKGSYSYPDSTAFEDITAVAPFWTDAEIAEGFGSVNYQVYERENSWHLMDAVAQNINSSILPDNVDFVPTWMLVVTWLNLLPPGGTDVNSFQAVLITDGRYSFAMFIFPECGMNWNFKSFSSKNVIIGYSDGNFENYQLQKTPPFSTMADLIYRPDLQTGNTGLKGRWQFRLEKNTENTVNSKKFCLDWYKNEPSPTLWVDGFDPCPPSYWQARRDRRYSWTARSYPIYWYGIPSSLKGHIGTDFETDIRNEGLNELCYQSSLFRPWWWWWRRWWWRRIFWWSWSPVKGNICCYRRSDFSLINGYQSLFHSSIAERYQFSHGWGFRRDRYENWFYNDLLPRYHCCLKSKDEYFCNKYQEKRPAATTAGYTPPGWGWFFGDPHMQTLDGYDYTFNGLGEYVLVTIKSEDSDEDVFVLQGRTQRAINRQNKTATHATVFNAFAAVFQNSTQVQIGLDENNESLEIYVDDEWFNISRLMSEDLDTYTHENGTFMLSYEQTENSSSITALWDSGISITVEAKMDLLNIVFSAPELYRNGSTRGLLGVWDGDATNDFVMRNGTLTEPSTAGENLAPRDLFGFGQTWKVSQEDSLFRESSRRKNATPEEDFVPIFLDELESIILDEDPEFHAGATAICGDSVECLFDALVTRDEQVGESSKESQETFKTDQEAITNFPPNITGEFVLQLEVGKETGYRFDVFDPDDDEVFVSLVNFTEGNLTDGLVSWMPTSLDKVSLVIQASDNQATSVLQPTIKLCNCQNDGSCAWDTYTEASDIISDKFAVVVCTCLPGWAGDFCEEDLDACQDSPCYPGVLCIDEKPPSENATCGECPENLVGDGFQCYDENECAVENPPCSQICTNVLGGYDCSCEEGYVLNPDDRTTCDDIDECNLQQNNCHDNADCVNTEGSFMCTCMEGYFGDGISCQDLNECLTGNSPCDVSADCHNNDGSYTCTCKEGFEGNGTTCTNIDECTNQHDDCHLYATCTDLEGSFSCTCDPGWTGNGTVCENIDECLNDPCHLYAECIDGEQGFVCICSDGFLGDGFSCQFIDVCADGLHDCDLGTAECVRNGTSYFCQCLEGFQAVDEECKDINECDDSVCSPNATCINTEPGYLCECQEGFQGDGTFCNDVDECVASSSCPSSLHECFNTHGSFKCLCPYGYENDIDGQLCIDVNECALNISDCQQTCTNIVGGYVCGCWDGYTVDSFNIGACQDIDECLLGIADCPQDCNNTIPEEDGTKYVCSCADGFNETESGECVAIDGCITGNITCTNGECFSVEGEERCLCFHGYSASVNDNTICEDIDECSYDGLNYCNQMCNNTIGSYTCACYDGFILDPADNSTCVDLNECSLEGELLCNTTVETCVNDYGGYSCVCLAGQYSRDSTTNLCIDIDECAVSNPCSVDATCTNLVGSFTCTCQDGFTGNGYECSDINECISQTHPHNCSLYAICTNLPGSFNCTCREGFTGNGLMCTDINECEDPSSCDTNANCENKDGFYNCFCKAGFTGDGSICFDIDECSLPMSDPRSADCHFEAICTNTGGSYNCMCRDGFTGNGTHCEDIDECNNGTSPCGRNSQCTNTEGSYQCDCNEGYRGIDTCSDINECAENSDGCHRLADCTNIDGSFMCDCQDGYEGDGRTNCSDVNECLDNTMNDCHQAATCQNTEGSYTCLCIDGFASTAGELPGRNCHDVDECLSTVPICDEEREDCSNTAGSYMCQCKDGFTRDLSQTCVDIDECGEDPCTDQANTKCVNTNGGYTCECRIGYYFSNSSGICTVAEAQSLRANFTAIQGLEVTGDLLDKDNLEQYRTEMENDVDSILQSLDSYRGSSVSSITFTPGSDVIYIHFNLEFEKGTMLNTTEIDITFRNGLADDLLPPDNIIVLSSILIGEPVIDPCVERTDNCTEAAVCVFSGMSGMFDCACAEGWTGDGFTECSDINECMIGTSTCSFKEECINVEGSHFCQCDLDQSYALIGGNCVASKVFGVNLTLDLIDGVAASFSNPLNDQFSDEFTSLAFRLCQLINVSVILRAADDLQKYTSCIVRSFRPDVIADVALVFDQDSSVFGMNLEEVFNARLSAIDFILDDGFSNITLKRENVTFIGIEEMITATPGTEGSTMPRDVTTESSSSTIEGSTTVTTTQVAECSVSSDCGASEICEDNQCVCNREEGYYQRMADGECEVLKIIQVSFAIVKVNNQEAVFNSSLEDSTSTYYISLETIVCNLLRISVQTSQGESLISSYVSCKVVRFFSGSIRADVDLVFEEDSVTTSSLVNEAIVEALQNSTLKDDAFGSLVLEESSVSAVPIGIPECNATFCFNNGTCSIDGRELVCSCDGEYTGSRCEDEITPEITTVAVSPTATATTTSTVAPPSGAYLGLTEVLLLIFTTLSCVLLVVVVSMFIVYCRSPKEQRSRWHLPSLNLSKRRAYEMAGDVAPGSDPIYLGREERRFSEMPTPGALGAAPHSDVSSQASDDMERMEHIVKVMGRLQGEEGVRYSAAYEGQDEAPVPAPRHRTSFKKTVESIIRRKESQKSDPQQETHLRLPRPAWKRQSNITKAESEDSAESEDTHM